jgi:hypothetical protein
MKIKVRQEYRYSDPISVNIDGLCNHSDYRIEVEECDYYATPDSMGQTEKKNIMVCNKCSSYKDEYADTWEGVQAWPL